MDQQRSFRTVIQALTLSGDSVEDMLDVVLSKDVDFNLVLHIWSRILQARSLLRLPRARSVKTAPLMIMDVFDEVQFKEQFRFSKTELCVILSNMLDLDGGKLVDDVVLTVMIRRITHKTRNFIQCWSDSVLMILLLRLSRWCVLCDLQILLGGSRSTISRISCLY
jgi:hypothetical protein